ncbi:hypothetical protein J4216_05355 [Candidatus Woesearchaeota archaeon]|nr:hypothetical protein [Candidatus Woesearchaeota archaeon]
MKLEQIALGGFLVLAACGDNPTPNVQDSKPSSSLDASVNDSSERKDSGTDTGNGRPDSGIPFDASLIDSGNPEDTGIIMNRKPRIEAIDRNQNPYTQRTVNPQVDVAYLFRAADPDNDSIEIRVEISDGYTRDWNSDPRVIHAIQMVGDYVLRALAKDDKGLESDPYIVNLQVRTGNLPPVAVLRCNERDPADGLCVYRAAVREIIVWDGSESYDPDGNIIEYTIEPAIGFSRSSGPESMRRVRYTETGNFEGRFWVKDNNDTESFVSFRAVIN